MYLTPKGQFNLKVDIGSLNSDTEALSDLINIDKNSKEKTAMRDGVNYYLGGQDVLDKNFNEYTLDGETVTNPHSPNNKIVNPHLYLQVEEKANYGLSIPITFKSEEEGIEDLIKDTLGNVRDRKFLEWGKCASKKGFEALHLFINKDGKFDYVIDDAIGLIPVFDTKYLNKLVAMYRYYTTITLIDGEEYELNTIEYWEDFTVTTWEEEILYNSNGKVSKDSTGGISTQYKLVSKKGHFEEKDKVKKTINEVGWGIPPFILLNNNADRINDLERIKSKIDDLDTQESVNSNDLAMIQKLIIIVKGFGGNKEEQEEAAKKFMAMKVLFVDGDGGLDTTQAELPHEALEAHLSRQEEDIAKFGQSVDTKTRKLGNDISGIVLDMLYTPLDTKWNAFELEMQDSLTQLMWFINEYTSKYTKGTKKSFSWDKVEFIFTKARPRNFTEEIDNLGKPATIELMPFEDRVALFPFNKDPQKALDKLEEVMPVEDNTGSE
jgi:SPP1 family phage portal protein